MALVALFVNVTDNTDEDNGSLLALSVDVTHSDIG
jgi:hypothetical protein